MRMKIEVEGCYYEDWHELAKFAAFRDIIGKMEEARSMIRDRLKWPNEKESEDDFLERLGKELWHESFD